MAVFFAVAFSLPIVTCQNYYVLAGCYLESPDVAQTLLDAGASGKSVIIVVTFTNSFIYND